MDFSQFEGRKRDHIRLSLDPSHQAIGQSGLDQFHLSHEALPDLDFDEIVLRSVCLGRYSPTPFYVSGMTAGHSDAFEINRTLALSCAKRGWAMGVGSQRRQLEDSGAAALDQWVKLREEAPSLTLFANIGISQLPGLAIDRLRELVETINAQALAVHANPLQECIQTEGTPRFRGTFDALRRVCEELGRPVVLKETGCGISAPTLERLSEIGLAAIDVSGLGGTHWGRIEGARARALAKTDGASDPTLRAQVATTFENWGESTLSSVITGVQMFPPQGANRAITEIWASGGVRSGLDAAKLLALGARQVGYAKPAMEAALEGRDSVERWMELQEFELKTALFCTGSRSLDDLRAKYAGGSV